MFEIIFENEDGKRLLFGAGTPYTITEFQGLNPPKATINTNQAAAIDGATFNSAKTQMRSVNIAFAIETNAEENRLAVYEVVQPKSLLRIYYKSDKLDIYIEGYVESVDPSYFVKKQIVSVAVLCPQPYFKGAKEIIDELSAIIPKFHFPFHSTEEEPFIAGIIDTVTSVSVKNSGYVPCGLIFEIYARKPVSNPKVFNYSTNEFFEINIDMQTGDLITVTTGQGNKTITLLRGTQRSNIFNLLSKNSTWLQLPIGGGVFVYEVGTGNVVDLVVTIKHHDLFLGV